MPDSSTSPKKSRVIVHFSRTLSKIVTPCYLLFRYIRLYYKLSLLKSRRKTPQKPLAKRIMRIWHVSMVLSMWGFIGFAGVLLYFLHDLPDIQKLYDITKRPTITILSEDHEVILKLGDIYGEYLTYEQIPTELKRAVLSTEDRRFFEHFGVDVFGLARAFYVNVINKSYLQGGSTITQQLAKIAFLTPERKIKRKIQEFALAMWLESQFSKEQILTMYLNRVYLAPGIYGIDAASHYYFGKPIQEVNLHETAVIAGLLQAPSRYNPKRNPQLAKQRAREVLNNMVEVNYISQEMVDEVLEMPLSLDFGTGRGMLGNYYFADYIVDQLSELVGPTDDDLIVVSTLDPRLQTASENSVKLGLQYLTNQSKLPQIALVSMENDGAIRSMVGGLNYHESPFNRVVSAQRQTGSTFKIAVYIAAFMNGLLPEDVMEDAPINIRGWRPKNYSHVYRGDVSLKEAIVLSINTVAAQVADKIGVNAIQQAARLIGFTSPMPDDLSISLGSNASNLLEMTQAYAHLAAGGKHVQSYAINTIINARTNKVVYQHYSPWKRQMIPTKVVEYMNDAFIDVINHGSGKQANLNRVAAGKTGTSQDYRDAWFVGYTTKYVAGVWIGHDDNSPMQRIAGGGVPAVIWRSFMLQAHKGYPEGILPTPMTPFEENRQPFWKFIFGRK